MASHHHFCQCHQPTTNSASCYGHCCYTPHTHCHQHHHYPLPLPPQDSKFQFPIPPQPHLYSVQSHIQNLHHHPHTPEGYLHHERRIHPTVSSLLSRIVSLESALHRRSSPFSSSHSLRDAAACTIQTHFRAFLLRRSRTLRQLKDLASIKSTLGLLKSSVYEKTHFDHGILYDKAMDLLLKLESVQGGDPMIRDGRKSVSRELNQFLDWIDAVCVERRGFSSNVRHRGDNVKTRVLNGERKTGSVKSGGFKGINVAKLKGLVEKIDKLAEELEEESGSGESQDLFWTRNQVTSGNRSGILVKQYGEAHPKVTKNVRFADNGKACWVSRRNSRPLLEEDCDDSIDDVNLDDAERQLEDDLCREVEVMGVSSKDADDEDGEENHSESGGSLPSSDGKKGLGNKSNHKAEEFVFAAPLPVKMEMRDGSIGNRRNS
ncbi:BAG family molecular chaperone regulator 8, chloroplastic-like [Primulina huaijiensis]|uniref:BAG family molecular chaperone regulator 8, chloroplastic-like n=1 Tax=Primulina huaijiensis TaxID=1492673 RepID=UPI003CC6E594